MDNTEHSLFFEAFSSYFTILYYPLMHCISTAHCNVHRCITVNTYHYTIPVTSQCKTIQKKSSHTTLLITEQCHTGCTAFAKMQTCPMARFNMRRQPLAKSKYVINIITVYYSTLTVCVSENKLNTQSCELRHTATISVSAVV